MANFYTDNEDLKFHLGHPLMQKIVALKERNFEDAGKCEIAPRDFEDAMDNYDRVLEIVGDICGNVLAENAESVDHEGPEVIDGRVKYAAGTQQSWFPVVMVVSLTSGDYRIVLKRFTSSPTRNKNVSTYPVPLRAILTPWT